MKKIIFLSLILTILVFLLLPRVGNIFNPQETYGFLKIESVPENANVFVDEKQVGVTPWESNKVEAGLRKIRLTVDNTDWEGKVEVAAGTETLVKRILGPSQNFSGGLVVSYQKTKNGNSSPSLAITAKPAGVKVLIDSKEYETPAVLDKVLAGSAGRPADSAGKHKLKFVLDGYLDEEIEVEIKSGFLTNVDVEMIVSPYGVEKIEKTMEGVITEGIEENKEGTEDLQIVPRTEWGGEVLDITDKDISFAPWQKIEVYPIIYANLNWRNNIDELINGMDFYAREFLGLYGLPFAYLITEDGKIYQGLGIRNFDFSKIRSQKLGVRSQEDFEFSTGFCPIAYVSTSSAELTESAQNALNNLQPYLAGPPQQSAKIITALEEITISPGETREVTLEFQNTGEAAWENSGDKRIFLVTTPFKSASEFYTKDSWIAVDTICLLQEQKVLPGETGKFIFSLTAPFYPAKINESLGLLIEGTEKIVVGSEVSLPISIWAEGLVAVEIMETPTGFLNVRDSPSTFAKLLGTVYPNEKYLYLDEASGFYKIRLRDGSEGWVYAKYAEKKT